MNKEIFNPENLIDRYGEYIYHIAIGHLKNIEDVEDVVQEVFLKYVDKVNSKCKFNDIEHEKKWITTVVLNTCSSENKRTSIFANNKLKLNEFFFKFESIQEYYIYDEIQKLDKKYRIPFELFYYQGFSIAEICDILSLSESNVKIRLKRTRDILKDIFKEGGEFNE